MPDTLSFPQPSQRIAAITPAVHGGRAHLMGDAAPWLDVSVNVNPYGPPPALCETIAHAITDATLARYPDPETTALRERLAAHLGLTTDMLLAGNGSVDLFQQIALAYLDPGDTALILGPAFGEYRIASELADAQAAEVRPTPDATSAWESAMLDQTLHTLHPRLIWVANPANPTGRTIPLSCIIALLQQFQGILVVDEAFFSLAEDPVTCLPLIDSSHLVVVRSLTKDFGLAGLRLGYLVAHPDLVATIRRARMPWSVNAVAQVAGIAALDHLEWLATCRTQLLADRMLLTQLLVQDGWQVVPSTTPFFLARSPDQRPATDLTQAILAHGITVRDATSFGLPQHIRIATQRPEGNSRLLAALRAVAEEGTR